MSRGKRVKPACSSRIQLRQVARVMGVRRPPLDRCEPGEQLERLLEAFGAANVADAIKRVRHLKRGG